MVLDLNTQLVTALVCSGGDSSLPGLADGCQERIDFFFIFFF